MTCEDCVFWHKTTHETQNYGQCRRYPPMIVLKDGNFIQTISPITHKDHWCGEFKDEPEIEWGE